MAFQFYNQVWIHCSSPGSLSKAVPKTRNSMQNKEEDHRLEVRLWSFPKLIMDLFLRSNLQTFSVITLFSLTCKMRFRADKTMATSDVQRDPM